MKSFLNKILLVILIATITNSCDAPRDNPLDPDNPDNTIHTITGIVQTTTVPFQPVEGVIISVKNGNYITQSDSIGHFQIELYESKNVTLFFEEAGYHSDSASVEWNSLKKINLNIHLNALPKLVGIQFYSSVLFRHPDSKTTSLTIKTTISDDERDDIEYVMIENDDFGFSKNLTYNLGNECYESILTSGDITASTIENVIGKDFSIVAQNAGGNKIVLGSTNIKRIINQQPEFISPANNIDTITVGPTLKWKRFEAGFDFTYKTEIYTNEVWPVLVWEKENISSTAIEIDVDDILPAGEYFWVFWCIDEFNNRVRSKPASFQIRQ